MKNITILFKKELSSYFNSPVAYIFTAIYLIAGNWLFFKDFFLVKQQAEMRDYFSLLPWLFLFLAPVVTMRIWSEEQKSGTIELLLTMPFKEWETVLAKFFSALAFLIIVILLSLSIPFSISKIGNIDMGPVIGGYLGAFFMGSAYLAIGIFISSLTKNQIIAFLIAVGICFGLFVIGLPFVLNTTGSLAPIFRYLGLGSHFNNIGRGVIDTRDIIYYVSITFFFLYLNVRSLESRNWR